jgi:hypothetical protein
MNTALLLSNAVALAIVLGFHFAPENGAEPVAQHAALPAIAEGAAVGGAGQPA